ncbi:MAG: thiamine-binding protein [Syntrophomonadaceae bacterium]|nr:thiamine-binding protein [Syntrophomonadaceae bacterium]MDD3889670.1 thiamine-binding protein [Syntrophomonadaceae bacterium]MDD4548699.1 thiamine-binding protein [Syntrophomonadaceae bacterium]
MSTANLSLQILPMVPEEEIYGVVDQVIAMIAASGMKYVVGPMETTIEGELDALLDLVKKAQTICTNAGANRVISVVKIDYSSDGVTIDEKIGKYSR